jgi:hypothetical protein
MDLQDYSSFFRPEEFDVLTAAYDAAWEHLWTKEHALTSDQVPVVRNNQEQSRA